ncbi:MAG: alpha/beta fold hydrolase [Desulfobacteraceae bacterium]|jgi:pimeloyl-ACP methyl ester carboxylesterase
MWIYVLVACLIYLILTLFFTYLVHQLPRQPVQDAPDWGKVIDTRIPTTDGGSLEVWRVDPAGHSRGVVVLAHGWSRNRDRMVDRARVFGRLGFTTVMHSARDHGGSSPKRFMNALRFAEDIEAVLSWVNEPVLLYGHSAGAAAAVIAASRNSERIKLLFLEGCYARTKEALLNLYRNYNTFFGIFFAPMVVLWMDIFYKMGLDSVSPVKLAPGIDVPVLLIHGSKDQNFPLHHVWRLMDSFPAGRAELFVATGSDHSSSSLAPEYPVAIKTFVDRHLPRS